MRIFIGLQPCLRFRRGARTTSTRTARRIVGLMFVGCVVAIGGCGETGPETIPVSGTVTYKGTPLSTGTVRFNPVDPKTGRPAEGTITSDGKFTLSTFKENGDGALAGEYNITVMSFKVGSEGLDKDQGLGIGGEAAIPAKYNDPLKSGLKEKIEAGKPRTDVKLDLTD